MNNNNLDLSLYVLDPTKSVAAVINEINKKTNGELLLTDPTNAFVNLLETTAVLTSAAINENNINARTIFPVLSTNTNEIYKHISDADIVGISSIPSSINIVFALKKIDVEHYSVKHEGYRKTTIPVNTEININDISFTLLNSIDIFMYDSGEINIEQSTSETGLGIDYLYILDNTIESDKDSVEWILFQTIVKQVKREKFQESVISSKKFTYTVDVLDKFFFTEVYAINNDNTRVKLVVEYNDTVFDLNTPSIYVKFLDNKVVYELPMIYQMEDKVNSRLEIILYTTKGNLNIPVEILTANQFNIILGDTLTAEASVMKNINKYVLSRGMLSYGTNGKSMEEIKKTVIDNTIGKISTAISFNEKEEEAYREGFQLSLQRDTVTKRTLIAAKNLPAPTVENINTRADLYMDTISFVLDNISDKTKILTIDDNIIIKSKNLFKFNNGIFDIVNDTEVFNISTMTKKDLVTYLNTNKILYNPFYYVIEKDYDVINSRVYDLDNPYLTELKVVAKNQEISPRCNIVAMSINIANNGYKVTLQVSGNEAFLASRPGFLYCQLSMKLSNSTEIIYFTEKIKVASDGKVLYFEFSIKSNFYIDSENGIYITSGNSSLTTKIVNIEDYMDIILYTLDPVVVNPNVNKPYNNLVMIDDATYLNVLTLESVKYKFGQELPYLWNDVKNFYTNKKFKRYTYDSHAKYSEDVYEFNEETQSILFYIRDSITNKIIDVEYRLKYKKGSVILDDYDNPIYAHRIGDYVLDVNGNMILDGVAGVVRACDILLVDYKFLVANNNYPSYVKEYTNTVVTWLNHGITLLNKEVLEETEVLLKPFKKMGNVKTISNNLITSHSAIVSPIVTLYIKGNANISISTLKGYKDTIGAIMHKHLETREFSLISIREEISTTLGSTIVGVKLENITSDNKEFIKVDSNDKNVFTLNKALFIDDNNNLDLIYDIELKIEKNI